MGRRRLELNIGKIFGIIFLIGKVADNQRSVITMHSTWCIAVIRKGRTPLVGLLTRQTYAPVYTNSETSAGSISREIINPVKSCSIPTFVITMIYNENPIYRREKKRERKREGEREMRQNKFKKITYSHVFAESKCEYIKEVSNRPFFTSRYALQTWCIAVLHTFVSVPALKQ